MDAGHTGEAAGIVALALDFHRAPTRHADLLHGLTPLPAGVGVLLKLAGGSEPDAACAALAPADELKAAALFFIEQVLFRHGASHYRVLGLEPGASQELIKDHHRLLMRVFHPDRENRADDWKDAFATRINLAYTSLRDAEARHRYDATLIQASRAGRVAAPARRAAGVRPHAAVASSRSSGLPPLLLRYLPQWVLAGTALVAVAIVGAVYLNNPPLPEAIPQPPARLAEPLDLVARAPASPEENAGIKNSPRPAAAAAPSASLRTPAPALDPRPASATPPVRSAARLQRRENPLPPAPAETHLAQASSPPPMPPAEDRALKMAAVPAPLPQPVAAPSPQPEPPRPADRAATPAGPDPDAMLARLLSSYERGDTQAFMALFDEVAIGPAGGKPQIRREHEALFRSTDLRHIAIDGMTWSREGDWIRGEGRYRATQMRKGEQWLRTEAGIIRIELLRRGEHALIMGLDFQPGGRS